MRYAIALIAIILVATILDVTTGVGQPFGPIIQLLTPNSKPVGPLPSITNVTLNGGSTGNYTSGASSGTSVGTIAVTMSDSSTFDGALATSSGTPGSYFTVSGSTLQTNSITPTCTSSMAYNFNIIASPGSGEGGSAYTRPVTVTCNPVNSIACDTGPPAASVPALAAQAGFTHCVANLDFSKTSYFTSTAAFLVNCGFSNGTIWSWALINYASANMPCTSPGGYPYATLENDSSIPAQILHTHWEYLNDDTGDTQGMAYPSGGGVGAGGGMPIEGYTEILFKEGPLSISSQSGGGEMGDYWQAPFGGQTGIFEIDMGELQANGNLYIGNYASNNPGSSYWQSYHKWENLITSDGSTIIWECLWMDGSHLLGPCFNPGGTPPASAEYTAISQIMWDFGSHTGQDPTNFPDPKIDNYIQNVEIWECAGYKTGPCPGTLVTN